MNRRIKQIVSGVAREDELRSRMVTSGKNELQDLTTDSPALPGKTEHYRSIELDESMESPGNESTDPILMIIKIQLFLSETDWTVEVETDKEIVGMVSATFCTNSSSEALAHHKAYNCSIDDLERLIRRELSMIGGHLCGTMEIHYAIDMIREKTETERCINEILCRLFKIEI